MQSMTKKAHVENKPRSINLESVKLAYRRYAGIYDVVFGSVFEPGRRAAVAMINGLGGKRILEVGVGTGLSLPDYRRDTRVTGIDVCGEMLTKARTRAHRQNLDHVEALLEMDAQNLIFPDNSFDVVVAMYVVSVVPSPERLLSEMKRVCVPGGEVIVVNHFASEDGPARFIERALSPLSATIGFRPDLELDWLKRTKGLELIEVRNMIPLGYWKLIHFRKPDEQPDLAGYTAGESAVLAAEPSPGD